MSSSNLRFVVSAPPNFTNQSLYSNSIPNRIPRRRKRPSHRSRERKSLSRHEDYSDSISIALDENMKIPMPSCCSRGPGNRSGASPLLRRSVEQSWWRWKEKEVAREKEERDAVMVREREERRIFGGDVGDDVSLCPKMLEVVRFLLGEDADFGYPGS